MGLFHPRSILLQLYSAWNESNLSHDPGGTRWSKIWKRRTTGNTRILWAWFKSFGLGPCSCRQQQPKNTLDRVIRLKIENVERWSANVMVWVGQVDAREEFQNVLQQVPKTREQPQGRLEEKGRPASCPTCWQFGPQLEGNRQALYKLFFIHL